jgi:hypothetical protein
MTQPTDSAPDTNVSPADERVSIAVDTPDDGQQPEGTPPEANPNSEAARYRVQLREAEAARDALAERVTGYQRKECEAAVANLLDVPGDLWDIGQADVSAFYNDDGTLNEAEVQAAAAALIDQRPRLGKPPGPRHQNFGQFLPAPVESVGWGSVVKAL